MENNKKKIITIIPIIISILLVIGLGTYALLLWTSKNNTNLAMRIGDIADVVFPDGVDINVSNISPVLDYEKDGYIIEFSITNLTESTIALNVDFNITSISDGLKEESFKYVLLSTTDKVTYTEVTNGDFSNVSNGTVIDLVTDYDLEDKIAYKLIIYIDGNMNNPSTMQGGTLTGYIDVEVLEGLLVTDEVLVEHTTQDIISAEDYEGYSSNTAGSTTLTLQPGPYKLEVWGAQGASYSNNNGGKGGYSYGTLVLTEATTIYAYTGGAGSSCSAGYNGGAAAADSSYRCYAGGGASDIRVGTDNLYARVIVAGGGGGAYYDGYTYATKTGAGGSGGGTSGISGTGGYWVYDSSSYGYSTGGEPGTQIAGGIPGYYEGSASGNAGSFGAGGSTSGASGTVYPGGGGGGWYGGGAGSIGSSSAGGGGSGWIYTADTFATWQQGNATDSANWLLNDKYYLINAETIVGDQSFIDYDGTTVTGHSGNGAIKITGISIITTIYSIPRLLGLTDLYIPQGSSINLTSGVALECATGETDCSIVSTSVLDTATLEIGTHTIYYVVKDEEGRSYRYPRTVLVYDRANITEYTTPGVTTVSLASGKYKLETWGAQGGSYSETYYGGKGGYSYGILTLTEETTIYAYVGGAGNEASTLGLKDGGTNGGGASYTRTATYASGSGGGASDIRIGTDSLYARVIVAGGGGGAGSYSSTATQKYIGGVGGGTSGGTGNQYSDSYKAGTGGGIATAGTSYYNNSIDSTTYGTLATFGTGAGAKSTSYNGISGGGGGWYGGGYGLRSSGGGGSGWVYTADAFATWQSGNATDSANWLLNSSYYLTNAATIEAGRDDFVDFDGTIGGTGHSGDGAVRITKLS